ncbi:MAG: insulinase family protein [Nitrospirae bacterium]|nr:insulinase family protein [Nitrospirota bacterium]
MKFPPLDFHPPKGERLVLPNGMILYLLEDHELPLINISATIQTGSFYEPADQIGLASLTGALMRTGGAGDKTGDEIDEILENLSASISTGIGGDSGYASLNVLTRDINKGFDLFADVLMSPRFSEEKLEILKNQEIENIRRKNDNPSPIAGREFAKLLYGAETPYAREATLETVSRIKRQDCVDFYSRYFHPDAMILGITGDFKKEEMVQKIANKFNGWKKRTEPLPSLKPIPVEFKPSVSQIEKALTQSYIRIGHLGVKQSNPDYYALSIMNDILGGQTFSSRLFKEVRTQKGLAYSVGSALNPGNMEVGTFFAYCQTMSKNTVKAISAIKENIKKMQETPVTPEELQLAKDSFLNSFIFSFTTPSQIVSRQIYLEYYHLPEDYMEQFRNEVSKVTAEDILRVAKKYLHPDGLTLLVVGDPDKFDQPLSVFGPVHTLPLSSN